MKIQTVLVSTLAVAAAGTVAQSCLAVATSTIGLAIIKKVLLGGIGRGLSIFKSKDAFLQNNLIDEAMPSQLRSINSILSKLAPHLVQQEREYIAQAAAYTVNISEPILNNAVNSLTGDDVTRIMQGGSGTATQVLKEKTAAQLVQAIMPKVDEKLNQFGIVGSINMALKGNNMLGGLFGGTQSNTGDSSLSRLASEQLVNGLFKIIENHEKQNEQQIRGAFSAAK